MSDAKIAKLATIHEWAELSVTESELTWEDAHRLISELGEYSGQRGPLNPVQKGPVITVERGPLYMVDFAC